MSIILMIVGLIVLIKCADWFVEGCSNIAKTLGIPSLIIGLTIVGFGTSAPETAVSVTASIKGMNDISIGNVVGSNIFNLLFILGICGLIAKLKAKKEIITRDFIYAILSSVIMLILSFGFFYNGGNQGIITRTTGLILLSFLGIYLYTLISEAIEKSKEKREKKKLQPRNIILIIVSLIGIIFGGQLVVNSATDIARMLGVSDNLIALTIVAIGTSLPELVTSLVATKKGEVDIAIGNVVGSNIFNIFFILGIASVISPITFGFESFIDIIVMLVSTILGYLLILKNKCIDKRVGIIFLLTYIIYMAYILVR